MAAAISLEGVSKHLSGRQVLRDISFSVEPGDIFGCLGPNGAGKTTTIRIILGLLKASAGTARVLGSDPGDDRIRNRVGFLLEVDGLYDNLSARDNFVYYGRLYGLRDTAGRISAVLDGAGLADRALDKVSTYSKGMRQRLALARSILHRPEVLVLDEPTAGLDPGGQSEVRRMLLDLSRNEGKTIFFELPQSRRDAAPLQPHRAHPWGRDQALRRPEATRPGIGEKRGGHRDLRSPFRPACWRTWPPSTGVAVESQEGALVTLSGTVGFEVPRLVAFLVQHGVRIEQVIKQQDSLEELYLRIEAEERKAGGIAGSGPVSRVSAIVRKDMLEIFRARGTYFYIPAMLSCRPFSSSATPASPGPSASRTPLPNLSTRPAGPSSTASATYCPCSTRSSPATSPRRALSSRSRSAVWSPSWRRR